jgi:acyl-coenzyme A synthetase/AMP-(fatty) acid ligase
MISKLNKNLKIVDENIDCDYFTLDKYISKTIIFLKKLNIKKNDKIVLFGENSIEFIILLFAINKIGAIFSIIDTKLNQKRLEFIFNELEAKCIFVDKEIYIKNENIIKFYFKNFTFTEKLLAILDNENEDYLVKDTNQNDIATIIYTSGSTGEPKGIICLNKNIIFVTKEIQNRLQYNQNDRVLCELNLAFDYGLYQIFLTLSVGATLIIKKNYDILFDIPSILYHQKITIFPVVPTIINTLLISKLLERVKLPNLRMITSTGDIFSVTTIKKLQKLFPQTKIIPMYGISECKRVAIMPNGMLEKKLGSIGKPLDNIKVHLTKDGELVVDGLNVMAGYLNEKNILNSSTYFKIENGKRILYTGDYFRQDNDGYLYFIGREDDIIKFKSKRISLKEIENSLIEKFLFNEITIIYQTDIFYIFIYSTKNIEQNSIYLFLRNQFLINITNLKLFIQNGALPKSSNGKIDKNELLQQYL